MHSDGMYEDCVGLKCILCRVINLNYCSGEQQDAGEFLTGIMSKIHCLIPSLLIR